LCTGINPGGLESRSEDRRRRGFTNVTTPVAKRDSRWDTLDNARMAFVYSSQE